MAKSDAQTGQLKSIGVGCAVLTLVPILLLAYCASSSEPTVPEKPGATAKQDAVAFYRGVISAGTACDAAFKDAGAALGTSDAVAAYRKVKSAEDLCLSVGPNIKAIEVPASVGKDAHAKLTEARDRCDALYANKWAAMDDIGELLDGDGGVAKMAGVQDTLEQINSGTITCVTGLMGPLVALGVDLDKIEID